MAKKTSFTTIAEGIVPILADNVAWGVSVRMINHIMQAARIAHDRGDDMVLEADNPELNMSPYHPGDQVYEAMQKAVDLLDAAEIDGIDRELIEVQLETQMEKQFQLDSSRIKRRDFDKQAFDILFESDDEFASATALVDVSEEKKNFVRARVAQKVADLKAKAVKQQIAFRDARMEYRELAEVYLANVLNPPSNMVVTGSGNYDEYLESRESAFNARIKGLKGETTMVAGQWINRYDFNGELDPVAARELDTYVRAVIDEGIRLRYEMPEYPRSPEDAAAAFRKLQAVS